MLQKEEEGIPLTGPDLLEEPITSAEEKDQDRLMMIVGDVLSMNLGMTGARGPVRLDVPTMIVKGRE